MTANIALLNEVKIAIENSSVDRRRNMLRQVTDLFLVNSVQCTDEELELFDDIFSRLTERIETSVRALLAARLAPIKNSPPNIIYALAFDDEVDVAAPVLEQSERLDDPALVESANTKSQAHLLAISRRRSLSPNVTDVLVERGDQQVVLSTAENRGARFSDAGFGILVRRSEGDDRLGECVGSRPEIPPHLFLKLLAKASKSVRAKLEAAHPHAKSEVRQAVAEVTDSIRAQVAAHASKHTATSSFTETLHRSGQLNDAKLAGIAGAGRLEEIAIALALMSELPLAFVKQALTQERKDTFLVVAKAAGLSWSTVKTILLLGSTHPSVPTIEIARCLASFERLQSTTAQEIVRFYRMRERPNKN